MQNHLIVVAGGVGKRMNSTEPKQFLLLNGLPIILHSINQFVKFDSSINIIIALHEDYFEYWEEIVKKHKFTIPCRLVKGGAERFDTVKNALSFIPDKGLIAIHDSVRPLVSVNVIKEAFRMASEKGNAIPVIPLKDSIREINNLKNSIVDRSKFVLIQTPQCFDAELLKRAYQQPYSPIFTDDSSVVEALGIPINLIPGNSENIKITEPSDLIIAEALDLNK